MATADAATGAAANTVRLDQEDAGHPAADETRHAEGLDDLLRALFPAREDLPREPRQARSRGKRDELVRAAARLFVEQGYAATTADEIAAAAGVSVGTFYNYFRNKRQILVVLVMQRLEDIFANLRLAGLDFTAGDHRTVIRREIAAIVGSQADAEQTGLRRVWAELMSLEPELAPYQDAIRRHVIGQLEERLRAVAVEGRTWTDLDVPATAYVIFTLLDALSVRPIEPLADERLIESVTDVVYRAIFPPEPRPSGPTGAR